MTTHKNPKILILGSGQIATICRLIATRCVIGCTVQRVTRQDLDLNDPSFILKLERLAGFPDVVINGMAYTDVDGAEDDFEMAAAVNHVGVQILADYCRDMGHNPLFIHFGTDYVFSGQDVPMDGYTETDPTYPINAYGTTKLAGEYAVLQSLKDLPHYVLRTSSLWCDVGPFKNFVKTVTNKLLWPTADMNVLANQFMCPTYVGDLAHVVMSLINWFVDGRPFEFGLYHMANSGSASWFEFARAIEERVFDGTQADRLKPADDYPSKAPRPPDSRLDCSKWEAAWGHRMRHWREPIKEIRRIVERTKCTS